MTHDEIRKAFDVIAATIPNEEPPAGVNYEPRS